MLSRGWVTGPLLPGPRAVRASVVPAVEINERARLLAAFLRFRNGAGNREHFIVKRSIS
jgi:hypothetical protein